MKTALRRGDVFFLPEDTQVSVDVPGKENTERSVWVGKVYERKTNFDNDRYQLKSDIAHKLSGKGVEADWDIISRFVEHVAKNRPPERFYVKPGEFVVTFLETRQDTNNEVVHCRRYGPTVREDQNHVHFLQNKYGSDIMKRFEVLFRIPMTAVRPMSSPSTSSLKNFEVRSVPPFQLIVRKRKKLN